MIKSNSKAEPFIYLICFKKKLDGTWEKPSKGDGKIIKCSLEEIAMMLGVLNKERYHWQNYHEYNEIRTTISFEWEDDNFSNLWIKIGKYRRYLSLGEIRVMFLLLAHLLEEKIIYGTIPPLENKRKPSKEYYSENDISTDSSLSRSCYHKNNSNYPINKKNTKFSHKKKRKNPFKDLTKIGGTIKKGTKKALLISFSEGYDIWIPKSTIHNNYVLQKRNSQEFLIDNWILERNNLLEK